MVLQHSNDYKLSAVKLYLKLKSIRKVSELLDCKKSSLHRWIIRYFETYNVDRKIYKQRKSIITKNILNYIQDIIKLNPTITLSKIKKNIIIKFNINISSSYLFYIIKYKLKLTHKLIRKKYYPEKKLITLKLDKLNFYNKLLDIGIKNIISIDESGFYLNMTKNNGRSPKGKRCYKTVHKYPFVKFNFICAIKYGKIIGYKLYPKEKGGINAFKFNEFYNKFIKNKYKNHLIILDNANFHKSKDVIDNINKTKNKIIYSLPYNPNLNPIENLFSQIKSHVKNKSPDNYEELDKVIYRIIKYKISKDNLKNYFKYLFIQANDFIRKNN
jgi:transposase